ncbi:MAG: hypothetical protein AAGA15_15535 [Pseudomonadota bacterium]
MKKENIVRGLIFFCFFFLLAACEPTITLMDRRTGEIGTGTAQNATLGSTGAIQINFQNEQFSGTWTAVRDPGGFSLGTGTVFNGDESAFGTFSTSLTSDSGFGTALLRSTQGAAMRCEFRYSLSTYTGVGVCLSNDGREFDMQLALF